jgi:uncharacterized membrane-anchored protein
MLFIGKRKLAENRQERRVLMDHDRDYEYIGIDFNEDRTECILIVDGEELIGPFGAVRKFFSKRAVLNAIQEYLVPEEDLANLKKEVRNSDLLEEHTESEKMDVIADNQEKIIDYLLSRDEEKEDAKEEDEFPDKAAGKKPLLN